MAKEDGKKTPHKKDDGKDKESKKEQHADKGGGGGGSKEKGSGGKDGGAKDKYPHPAAAAAAAALQKPNSARSVPTDAKDEAKKESKPTPFQQALEFGKKAVNLVPGMHELETLTKFHRIQIFLYALASIALVVLIIANVCANFLTHALGFMYPAIQSLRAAENGKKEEYQKWLSFWVIFSFLTLVEFTDQALLTMLPFYYFFKLLFLLWLILPYFNGASRMYHNLLKFITLPKIEQPKEEKKQPVDPVTARFGPDPPKTPKAPSKPSAEQIRRWGYLPLSKVTR
ncbi:TB2/DP1, HVA22 family-domain-containing protein [Zopfochytrium polystomum]|nr:TB2/DP1, HVA22 family-domain-containing protein [Zopfochytrium polystomum]